MLAVFLLLSNQLDTLVFDRLVYNINDIVNTSRVHYQTS